MVFVGLGALHPRPDPDRHLVHASPIRGSGSPEPPSCPSSSSSRRTSSCTCCWSAIALYVWHALRTPTLRQTWRTVVRDPAAMSAARRARRVPADLDARLGPLPPAAAAGARRRGRCRAGVLDAHAVAARRAARRPARGAREDLLGSARHAPVLEGVDAGRRQDRPRLPAAAVRRRASQGSRGRMGGRRRAAFGRRARRRARSPRGAVARSSPRCARARRRPASARRCAPSGSGTTVVPLAVDAADAPGCWRSSAAGWPRCGRTTTCSAPTRPATTCCSRRSSRSARRSSSARSPRSPRCRSRSCSASSPATSRAASTTRSSTSTPCCRRFPRCC